MNYNNKKIIHVSSVHVWNDTRIFFKEALSLQERGFKVVTIGISDANNKFYYNNIKVFALKRRRRSGRWITWILILKILFSESGDIYHFHDPELIPFGLMLKVMRKKVIYDMHEDFGKQVSDKEWIPKYLRKTIGKCFKMLERFIPRIFDVVIIAEDSYLNNFEDALNIQVVHNYPKLDHDHKNSYKHDTFKMVYVGDIRAVRGIYEYLKIIEGLLKNCLDVSLLVIGNFAGEEIERDIKRLIKERNLQHNIQFFGRLPNNEIYPIIKSCDIGLSLLHPISNFVCSYPTKIFEYMSVGLPVLASNFELWSDIIEKNECGYTVDPFNTEHAVEIIANYYNNIDLLERHGKNGLSIVKKYFSWENEKAKLYAVYDNLLNNT